MRNTKIFHNYFKSKMSHCSMYSSESTESIVLNKLSWTVNSMSTEKPGLLVAKMATTKL